MDRVSSYKIWGLAWPMILSHISQPMLGLVDIAVLGHLNSPNYLASVALGTTIIGFIYWCFGFLRMGTTANTAIAFGSQQTNKLIIVLWQAMALAILLAALIILLQKPLFNLGLWALEIPHGINTSTLSYLEIRLYSTPAALMNYVIAGWFVGQQRPKIALLCVIACNGTNIILDVIFVIGFGLHSDGVAWATVIAEYSSLLLGLVIIYRQQGMDLQGIPLARLFHWKAITKLAQQNAYLFLRTFLLLLTMAFMTKQSTAFGIETLAANTIILQLAMLVAFGLDGFANAAESLTGEAIGAKSEAKLKLAIRGTGEMTVLVSLLFLGFFILTKPLLIGLMTSQAEILVIANEYFYFIYLFCIIGCWSFWLDGVFIGAARFKPMMVTMFISSLFFISCWWFLQSWQNKGLWIAYMVFLATRGLSLAVISYCYSQSQAWYKST
jgi:MATE family multidrug resistance protein